MDKRYAGELQKLAAGLMERGIEFKYCTIFNGGQIICRGWDAICHDLSYGSEDGLIEITGPFVNEDLTGENSEGYLTAETILKRIDRR